MENKPKFSWKTLIETAIMMVAFWFTYYLIQAGYNPILVLSAVFVPCVIIIVVIIYREYKKKHEKKA